MTNVSPKRGEIWWAPSGSTLRPVLVLSADSMNRRLNKLLVVPGTTNLRGWPDEVLLPPGPLNEPTAFCCREVTPLAIVDLVNCADPCRIAGSQTSAGHLRECSTASKVQGPRTNLDLGFTISRLTQGQISTFG